MTLTLGGGVVTSVVVWVQWESGKLEDMEDEERLILEEAMELDHIWGVWEDINLHAGPS